MVTDIRGFEEIAADDLEGPTPLSPDGITRGHLYSRSSQPLTGTLSRRNVRETYLSG
jgi:hypothetical protein